MTQKVAIVGAGIAGMCNALAIARAGFQVEVYERDIPPPEGDANAAFFNWQRRGAAQFRHPHAFLGLMCSLLEEHYPDLLDAFFAAGARRLEFADMIPPSLQPKFEPLPGDEKMWMLLCRRATLETVLRRYVEDQGNIRIHNTHFVTGIETEESPAGLTVTGLTLTDRAHNNAQHVAHADVFVDAAGRASKFRSWLMARGADIAEDVDDAEIVYYTRHYKLQPGVAEPDRHKNDPAAGDIGYMKYGVFPGDAGHFALIVCLPNDETELREAIKDGDQFDAICRQIPGLVPWIAEDKAEATTAPFGIGEIHAVWRDYTKDGVPQVLNFFAVGDASARTNPLYGRGCSTGILHAHLLAEVLTQHRDPRVRALEFQRLTNERIKPIFDASLAEDKNGIRRARAVMQNQPLDKASSLRGYFRLAFGDALAAAVRDQMHIYRGMMRTVNLIEKPGEFLTQPDVKRTLAWYMLRGRRRNARARTQRGPNRDDMLTFVRDLASEA